MAAPAPAKFRVSTFQATVPAVAVVEASTAAMPSAAMEVSTSVCPRLMSAAKGSVQPWPVVGDMAVTMPFSTRSVRCSLRTTCSMVLAPSSPGVAPENSSELPPGASSPSVVCT